MARLVAFDGVGGTVRLASRPARLLVAVVATLLASWTLGVAAADAAPLTFNVNVMTDTGTSTGACLTGGSCSLRQAANSVNLRTGGDTIMIAPGTYTLNPAMSFGQIEIDKSTTITGSGSATTLISGGDLTRIFQIGDTMMLKPTVSISGVTLEHGNSTDRGGAILVENGSSLTVSSSVFDHNTAANNGGALEVAGAPTTLTVQDSVFSANTSGGSGGAIDDIIFTGSGTSATTVTRSTLTGNHATAAGGAVSQQNDSLMATLNTTVTSSVLSGNTSGGAGGGIADSGGGDLANLTVTDSTITQNTSGPTGGGFTVGGGGFNIGNGPNAAVLTNDTIVANTATGSGAVGGNITVGGGPLPPVLTNDIVAQGVAPTSPNCSAHVTSGGHNLEDLNACGFTATGDMRSVNPMLGPLQANGGPTQTMALLSSSPAINAGASAGCPAADQRGVSRPQGASCDIGAFEFQVPVLAGAPSVSGTPQAGQMLTCNVNVTVSSPDGPTTTSVTWLRDGAAVATGPVYPIPGADAGHALSCSVLVTNAAGVASVASAAVVPTAAPAGGPPSNAFTVAGEKTGKDGSLVFTLNAPGAGSFTAVASTTVAGKASVAKKRKPKSKKITYGKGSVTALTAGTVMLTIKPSSAAKRVLRTGKRVSVKVSITFTPTGGTPKTTNTTVSVKLKKKKKK